MFDIPDGRPTTLYVREFDRRMTRLEKVFGKEVKANYHKQFRLAAEMVEQGIYRDSDMAVDAMAGDLRDVFIKNYKRIGNVFSDWAFDEIDKEKFVRSIKGPKETFWSEFDEYTEWLTAQRIVIVNNSQKELIRRIIKAGMREGLSNREIAKKIMSDGLVAEKFKAIRIARTETHSAANHAVQTTVKATGRRMWKQWAHSMDDRVRSKKFNHRISEVVKINDSYEGTGELLDYPGDPSGSAGNIINCRCVEKYLTSYSGEVG